MEWTAVISLSTDDINYDMQDLLMSIAATSVMSTMPEARKTVTADFNIKILHPCRKEELNDPEWEQTSADFDFRDLNKDLTFFKAEFSSQPECGDTSFGSQFAITHSAMEVFAAPFTFQVFSVSGSPTSSLARISAAQGTYRFNVIA